MLLRIEDATVHYNKVAALKGISMEIPEGGIVTIIGANGAGKSTTLRAISGLVPLSSGEIHFDSKRIDGLPADEIVSRGIAHVPEGRRVFPDLSVEENLRTGAFLRKDKAAIAKDLEYVFSIFPRLRERRKQWAKTLSGGEQQMVAIGRALMAGPRMLLLDEPSMGLAPVVVQEIAGIILDISRKGVPVVLVEQNAELALRLANFAYVMEVGRVSLAGQAEDLHENEHVKRALPRRLRTCRCLPCCRRDGCPKSFFGSKSRSVPPAPQRGVTMPRRPNFGPRL